MSIHTLVIEDEAILAMDMCQMLESLGHIVSGTALTHQDAVRKAKSVKPNLIVADISLADHSNGVEAVSEISRELGSIPVIFVTGHPDDLLTEDRPMAMQFLRKPINKVQLVRAINSVLEKGQADA